jgi:hypothetical protein
MSLIDDFPLETCISATKRPVGLSEYLNKICNDVIKFNKMRIFRLDFRNFA